MRGTDGGNAPTAIERPLVPPVRSTAAGGPLPVADDSVRANGGGVTIQLASALSAVTAEMRGRTLRLQRLMKRTRDESERTLDL